MTVLCYHAALDHNKIGTETSQLVINLWKYRNKITEIQTSSALKTTASSNPNILVTVSYFESKYDDDDDIK